MTGHRIQVSIDNISVTVSDSDRVAEAADKCIELLQRINEKLDVLLKQK